MNTEQAIQFLKANYAVDVNREVRFTHVSISLKEEAPYEEAHNWPEVEEILEKVHNMRIDYDRTYYGCPTDEGDYSLFTLVFQNDDFYWEPITAIFENWNWSYELPEGHVFCPDKVEGVKSIPVEGQVGLKNKVLGYAVPIHQITLKEALRQTAVGFVKSMEEELMTREDGEHDWEHEHEFGQLLVYIEAEVSLDSDYDEPISQLNSLEVKVYFGEQPVIPSAEMIAEVGQEIKKQLGEEL